MIDQFDGHETFDKKQILDHGYLQLVETWGSDERIIEAARMSTAKGFQGWGPRCACSEGGHSSIVGAVCPICGEVIKVGDEKLLRFLWENNHATPFEMAGATFEVRAPIFVFREWHRHRVPFGYNEASARYAPLPALDYLPTVERCMLGGGHLTKQAGSASGAEALTEQSAGEWIEELAGAYEHVERVYQSGLRRGIPKEVARCAMVVARYSTMRATGNLRGWLSLLQLRMPKNVQWEFRQYSHPLHEILADIFPRTLALFDEGR